MSSAVGWVAGVAGAALLAGGFAAGYVLGSSRQPTVELEPEPIERALHARPAAPSSGPAERAVEPPRLEGERAAELEPLRQVLEALPAPSVPRGSGVITGGVKTEDGETLAGVKVTADPEMPKGFRPTSKGAAEDLDLPSSVERYVNGVRWSRSARRQALTGADGLFRFDDLTDTPHAIRASRDGWGIRAQARGANKAEPGDVVEFTARRLTRVRVQVYLPDGTQPEKASLVFQATQRPRYKAWRKEEPLVEVQPGSYAVTATAGEAQEYKSEPVRVTVDEGGLAADVRIDLKGRPILKGRVVFPEGEVTPRASVRILRLREGQGADPALLTANAKATFVRGWHERARGFQFQELRPGPHLLGVARTRGGAVVATRVVEVTDGLTEVDVAVPPLRRAEYAILRVTDPDGKPLSDLTITTGHRSEGGSSSGGSVVVDRGKGVKWVLHHDRYSGDAKDGRNTISVHHDLYGTREVDYAVGTAPAFDVRFGEPVSLEVTVTGLVGTAYDGRVHVGLQQAGASRRLRSGRAQSPDEKGRLLFEGLQPGEFDVVFSLEAGPFGFGELAREAVVLHEGLNHARLAMPTLYAVTFAGVEGRAVVRRTEGRGVQCVLTASADGRAVADGLPAGTYTVYAGQERVEFRLPGATTVRIE